MGISFILEGLGGSLIGIPVSSCCSHQRIHFPVNNLQIYCKANISVIQILSVIGKIGVSLMCVCVYIYILDSPIRTRQMLPMKAIMFSKDAIEDSISKKNTHRTPEEWVNICKTESSSEDHLKTREHSKFPQEQYLDLSPQIKEIHEEAAARTIGSKSIYFTSSLWLGRDLQKSLTWLQA